LNDDSLADVRDANLILIGKCKFWLGEAEIENCVSNLNAVKMQKINESFMLISGVHNNNSGTAEPTIVASSMN